MKRAEWVHAGLKILIVAVTGSLILAGCSGGGTTRPGSASYTLKLLLEKNRDSKADYLHLEFLRNDSAFAGAFAVVDGDTIRTKSSGTADTTYSSTRWRYRHTYAVKAVDTAKAYQYTTSVVIPDSFVITNIFPNTRIWQPNKANPRVEWTASTGATNYIASIQARGAGSPSRGQTVIAGSLTQTFTPTAFYNPQTNQIVPDIYYIHVVAYTPTFVERPDANYTVPRSPAFPLTVDTKQISGAVAAAVVAVRDTIQVGG